MRKGCCIILFILLVSLMSFALAQEVNEDAKVSNAYSCLRNKTQDCTKLSTDEQIFSMLALGACHDELVAGSDTEKCWPKSSCDIKTTSQAVLALGNSGFSVDNALTWLSSKNTSVTEILWYLQIESAEASACTITYDGTTNQITIGADKKINTDAGTCLSLSSNGYWLKISEECYNKEFSISCDKSFLTNLLYQKQDSPTIYVSSETNTGGSGGTTTQKVNSLCFSSGSGCDYEATLWASMALDSQEKDVSAFIPYLVTFYEKPDNLPFLPEAFLYRLTGEFKTELLAKQKVSNTNYYWEASGDEYFDTALALYPLQEDVIEKERAKEWLLSMQGMDGCWNNVKNTAFILASVWPSITHGGGGGGGTGEVDCEDAGYFCTSSMRCEDAGGDSLESYMCAGSYVCCSKEIPQETCAEQEGKKCSSTEICDGASLDASDLSTDESCCVGTCGAVSPGPGGQESACVNAGGNCRVSCKSNEDEISRDCEVSTDKCCEKSTTTGGKANYTLIIIFSILIVLILLGILFRKKLGMFWFKLSSKFKGGGAGKPPYSGTGPRPPFSPPTIFPQRMPQRVFTPSQERRTIPSKPGMGREFDDVLKKLKEMGE